MAVGNVDAHVTSPAARAIAPGQMLAVMGTSTCHVMNGEVLAEVPGMCGVVRDGITPGLWGYEAGQSGVGDIFAWFTRTSVPESYVREADRLGLDLHEHLTNLAAQQAVGEHGLVVLDWHLGNRSVLVDHELSGLVVGLTIATRPEEVYRALLEATAFGTRRIIEAFETSGVPVREFVVAGGLLKNSFLMQTYADVTRRPLSLLDSAQGPALGSAIHAAVAAGAYPDVFAASEAMGRKREAVFVPDPDRALAYDALYAEYTRLHDAFGPARRLARRADASTPRHQARGGHGMSATDELRRSVAQLNIDLPALGTGHLDEWQRLGPAARTRTCWSSSQAVSAFDDLTPESMVVCDLDGNLVEGELAPSSDTAAHAYVYRAMPDVGGVVHTHSTYATAWAARAEEIPCVLTAMADEFGGPIPVGPFALVGSEAIGKGIVSTLAGSRSPAVLMRNHGVFTIGPTAKAAVKAAVMCEDVARTVHLARQLGDPLPIAQADIDAAYERYQGVYGQR